MFKFFFVLFVSRGVPLVTFFALVMPSTSTEVSAILSVKMGRMRGHEYLLTFLDDNSYYPTSQNHHHADDVFEFPSHEEQDGYHQLYHFLMFHSLLVFLVSTTKNNFGCEPSGNMIHTFSAISCALASCFFDCSTLIFSFAL